MEYKDQDQMEQDEKRAVYQTESAAGEQQTESAEQQPQKKNRRNGLRQTFIAVAAGVAGSVFTLAASPFVENFYDHGQASGGYVQTVKTSATGAQTVSTKGNSVSDMVEKSSKAIVGVVNMQKKQTPWSASENEEEAGTGSGVIYKIENGNAYIVTNNHVIEGADNLTVSLPDGKTVKANVIGSDALTDLAVLKISSKNHQLSALEFGSSEILRAGDKVWAIGNPLGLDLSRTVTEGIISGVNRTITTNTSAGQWDLHVIQTDAAINPGNSGGALMNSDGQVIGINSLKISESNTEGLGFAIPSNDVVSIINQITEHGKVQRPFLGVSVKSVAEIPEYYLEEGQRELKDGVMVIAVDPESPAGKAGIEVKDVVTAINGEKISSEAQLRKFLYTKVKIGDKVTLSYVRGGKTHEASAVLKENQQAGEQTKESR